MTAFLKGLSYTENCYHCHYARLEKVSDITLGDSWGSTLPSKEIQRGISLILCQTRQGMELVEESSMCLQPVDLEQAVEHNRQLRRPSERPVKRDAFLNGLRAGKKMNGLVRKSYPLQYYWYQWKGLGVWRRYFPEVEYGVIYAESKVRKNE